MHDLTLVEPSEISAVIPAEEAEIEVALKEKIPVLWVAHKEYKIAATRTKKEVAKARRELAAHLFQMKSLLARTGRGGQWSSFLRQHKIPRATADRYALAHEAGLKNAGKNLLNESIPETIEVAVNRLVQKILPQTLKVVTTKEVAFAFTRELLAELPPARYYVCDSFIEVHFRDE